MVEEQNCVRGEVGRKEGGKEGECWVRNGVKVVLLFLFQFSAFSLILIAY
jgi:hypothetical protein